MQLHQRFGFVAVLVLCFVTHVVVAKPRPVVIWHGLGDSYDSDGMTRVSEIIKDIYPGIFIHSVYVNPDSEKDSKQSLFGKLDDQLAYVCDQLASIPELSSGFDGVGFSQGGLFLRAYVERCNSPPVGKLLTFGSPHNGVFDFPPCDKRDFICRRRNAALKYQAYSYYAQDSVTVAQYYRDTERFEEYLERSAFLADVNNEREVKNETYKANLASLEQLVMYLFLKDETVVPKESAWFANVDNKSGSLTMLENRELYKQDWLGLRELGESGRTHFRTIEGRHMSITDVAVIEFATQYLGTEEKGELREHDASKKYAGGLTVTKNDDDNDINDPKMLGVDKVDNDSISVNSNNLNGNDIDDPTVLGIDKVENTGSRSGWVGSKLQTIFDAYSGRVYN
ncbi:Alpha/Beta hydrolase protein [Lipomyces japonicus]|uniref:Alpha/Beta hydrolase protein n=1 Tax=Lipomyces japonicus TaxID=56871 RepID=UPI0034CEF5E8